MDFEFSPAYAPAGEAHEVPDVRDIVDWAYYRERLGSAIQKIITIPAAMQRVENPVPRIRHPDWLHKMIAEKNDVRKQTSLSSFVTRHAPQVHIADLEDIGQAIPSQPLLENTQSHGIANTSSSGKDNGANDETMSVTTATLPMTPPARSKDFTGWLRSRKESWRKSRLQRKRKRENSSEDKQLTSVKTGLEFLFAQQSDSLARHTWQIVSFAPTSSAGLYKAWAVINAKMYAITVRVPRTFYINTTLPEDDQLISQLGGRLVKKQPPDQEALGVFEINLLEEDYRNHLAELQAKLMSCPEVKEVYEAQIPPQWSAVMSIGCTAQLVQSAKQKNIGDGFDLHELLPQPVVQEGYFDDPGNLKSMTLYQSEDPGTGRSVYGLHLPSEAVCHLWILNPARGGQKDVHMSHLQLMWNETRDSMVKELDDDDDSLISSPEYKLVYLKTKQQVVKSVRQTLGLIRYVYTHCDM